jgi:hypothetical protein
MNESDILFGGGVLRSQRTWNVSFAALISAALFFGVNMIALAQGGVTKSSVLAEKIAAMHRAWGPKASSPGTTLRFEESARAEVGGHKVIKYRLITSGLPSEKLYSLMTWPLDGQPSKALTGVAIDDKGIAICPGRPGTCGTPDKPDDPIDLALSGGLAEPKRFALISTDQTIKVFAAIVPFPNGTTDHGCTLAEVLLVGNAEAVILRGSGFSGDAKVLIAAVTNDEKQEQSVKADESGAYEMVMLPFKKGVAKGRTTVTFRTDTCSPSLSFDWGKDSYQLQ